MRGKGVEGGEMREGGGNEVKERFYTRSPSPCS